jgi:membrane protein
LVQRIFPQQVAAPIANEIHNVLTQTRSRVLTIGVILSIYFSSSGVEAVRIGLNRAYNVRDSRPWWLLRLESIAYVFVGAFSLLALAFLVIFAPLIWTAVLHFAPGLEPLNRLINFGRFAIASLVLLLAHVLSHKFLPAGPPAAVQRLDHALDAKSRPHLMHLMARVQGCLDQYGCSRHQDLKPFLWDFTYLC